MLRAICTISVILSLTACASRTEGDVAVTTDDDAEAVTTEMEAEGEAVVDTSAAAAPLPAWQLAIEPNEGFDIAGEGRINALPGNRTRAAIEIRNAESGAQHPWHVHEGQCGSNGAIVGDPAAYAVLTADPDGEASGVAMIELALDPEADYYVNIHKSPSETDTIVACGSLRGTGTY